MSRSELIEKMRPMPTEEKRAFVEQVLEEYGEELGWVDRDLTLDATREMDRRLAKYEQNPNDGAPWDEVKARLQRQRERRP